MLTSRWQIAAIGMIVVIALPFAAKFSRRGQGPRCEFDGAAIEPLYRVTVIDEHQDAHGFCCVRCAEGWLQRSHLRPQMVLVTDEIAGQSIDARSAFFVRSIVITNPTTGNRCHVFQNESDAESHRAANRGVHLTGSEQPFRDIVDRN